MADDTSDLPLLPVSLALAGYSTVGKDTLIEELAKYFRFTHLSAGHPFKDKLIEEYGLSPEHVYGNGPLRNTPHPALPKQMLPADPTRKVKQRSVLRHMTPREAELMLQAKMARGTLAIKNRDALLDLVEQRQPFIFNGYRFPEQDRILRGVQEQARRYQQLRVFRIKLLSPQVPKPVPHSEFDDLLDGFPFEGMLWNDKTKPPSTMLEQLALLVAQITKAPLF